MNGGQIIKYRVRMMIFQRLTETGAKKEALKCLEESKFSSKYK
jgi:hypothetical protein